MKTPLSFYPRHFIVLLLLLCSVKGWGQTTLSKWALTTDGTPNSVAAHVSAGDFTKGSGISNITYGSNGAYADSWTTLNSPDATDYFQITVAPSTGYTLNIQQILFGERRSGTGIRNYQVQYSTNADFSSATTIATVAVPDNDSERTGSITDLSVAVDEGKTLYIRFFGYSSEAAGGRWRINDGTLEIKGTVTAATINPEPSSHATDFACGTGTATSIPLTWTDAAGANLPSKYLIKWSAVSYGDISAPVDGTPESDGAGALNVHYGVQSANITGLNPNTTYYFKIFPYSNNGANIDYKTGGAIPQTSGATAAGPCFSEDFNSIINGNSTDSNGSGTAWSGNTDFPVAVKAFQAGGAVRLGTSDFVGSVTSRALTEISGNVTVKIKVKGWTTVEGGLKVILGSASQTLTYTAVMSSAFEEVSATFTGVPADSTLKIETTAKRAFIDNVEIFCGTSTSTTLATDHFRSKTSGDWTAVSTWESSHNGTSGWADADLAPSGSASGVNVQSGHTVLINNNSVIITNTSVNGVLKVTDYNFQVTGSDDYELNIENGGELLVDGLGYKTNIGTDQPYALVKTGGKVTVGNPQDTAGFSENIVKYYLNTDADGLLVFEGNSICDWTYTSGYPKSNGYPQIFSLAGDGLPVFRISGLPANQSYGNSTNSNTVNAVLEINSSEPFNFGNNTVKTIVGGIRGTGMVNQNSNSGILKLGDSSHVPVLGGTVTVSFVNNRLEFPNGADVPEEASVKLVTSSQNNSANRSGGMITVNGTLDITNARITNTASGGIIVNGILRTSNTGGLYGAGSAIVYSENLTLNPGSTVEYYGESQSISSGKTYDHIIFSGSGTKTPQSAIDVSSNGSVYITGNPVVDFSSKNLASTSDNNTSFSMDGGRLLLGTAQLLPNMKGAYNITGGTIEFTGNAKGIRTPRIYNNIEISVSDNKEVVYSGGNLTLNNDADVLVKSGAILTSTNGNASLVGTSGNVLTIESGGTFRTAVIAGFYGEGNGIAPSPSVRNNISLNLLPGSNVEYARLSGEYGLPVNAQSGDQTVTPVPDGYQNLNITGDGVKTAYGEIRVNQLTSLKSNTAILRIPSPTAEENIFHAMEGIDNNSGNSGLFILENDAMMMQNETADNSRAFIQVRKRFSFSENRNEYNFLSSPVMSQNMKKIFGDDASYIPYVTVLNEASNYYVNASAEDYLIKAKGFAVKEPVSDYEGTYELDDNEAEFKGIPNNGSINIEITKSADNRGWNLIGNPYPSNLDLYALYHDPANNGLISSEFRFWDNRSNHTYTQYGGNYNGYSFALYNAESDMGNPAPGGDDGDNSGSLGTPEQTAALYRYAKTGQGFLIRKSNTGNADLKIPQNGRTSMQPTNGFFGRAADSSRNFYRLQMLSSGGFALTQTVLYYDGGSNGFGIEDSRYPSSSASDKFYSFAGDENVIINGRAAFDASDMLPLGTRHYEAGTYTIRATDVSGAFESDQHIYLKDKQLNIITDLSTGSYTFYSDSGDYTDRFEIVYKPESALATASSSKEDIKVYRSGSDVVVRSYGSKITGIEVYDMSGRMLRRLPGNSTTVSFPESILTEGVYVLKIWRGIEVSTKKIIR